MFFIFYFCFNFFFLFRFAYIFFSLPCPQVGNIQQKRFKIPHCHHQFHIWDTYDSFIQCSFVHVGLCFVARYYGLYPFITGYCWYIEVVIRMISNLNYSYDHILSTLKGDTMLIIWWVTAFCNYLLTFLIQRYTYVHLIHQKPVYKFKYQFSFIFSFLIRAVVFI